MVEVLTLAAAATLSDLCKTWLLDKLELHVVLETMITFCAGVAPVTTADGVVFTGLFVTVIFMGEIPGIVFTTVMLVGFDVAMVTGAGVVRVTTTVSAELLRRRFLPP